MQMLQFCIGDDVGIAPYEPPGSAQKFVGADASVRPEELPISPQVFAFRMCGLRGDRVCIDR